MAQSLDDQIVTIERALGERMIEHALVIVHSWLVELGENNPYIEAYHDIRARYDDLFAEWLNVGTEQTDVQLNALTGEAYQLVDAVYAAIRVKRGLSPDMHGFNPEHPQSVIHYFSSNVQLRPEDLEWLHQAMQDSDKGGTALMAVGSLAKNLRECFHLDAMLALVRGINAGTELVADQCMASVLTLLIQYDIRIDFFEQLQDAFMEEITQQGDEGEHAFDVLCAVVKTSQEPHGNASDDENMNFNQLPEELRNMLEMAGLKKDVSSIVALLPESEREYMQSLVDMLPDTWLYEVLVAGNSEREENLARVLLSIGRMDLSWDRPAMAEEWLVRRLRKDSPGVMDYINYAHCQLLKGDRMMAFEYYRQARQMCSGAKDFFNLFRPDRRALVDHGIPLEQIYLLEDRLINT